MQLHAERFPLAITECAPGHIVWARQRLTRSVLLRSWIDAPQHWGGAGFDGLGAEDFALLAEGQPDVVLFGSGGRLRFPPQPWLAPLAQAGISLETMSTAAACRTWNVLAGEGRRVAAALLLDAALQL
ncbi:MAG: hypothetical protein J6T92_06305 [Ottowia sp.]|nr:hypothetical protein [Ottowia sp.]